MFRSSRPHFLVALLILVIEILIALFVRDAYIRPHGGDLLVMGLMYFALRSVLNARPALILLATLVFAFGVEFLQASGLLHHLGWSNDPLAVILLGNTFQWMDLLMYLLGGALAWAVDQRFFR